MAPCYLICMDTWEAHGREKHHTRGPVLPTQQLYVNLPTVLAHRITFHVDAMCVVHQAVEDGAGGVRTSAERQADSAAGFPASAPETSSHCRAACRLRSVRRPVGKGRKTRS